jgi:hypothetical protein
MSIDTVNAPRPPHPLPQLTPAKQARDAIQSDPSLDASPFGKLVSQYAQNQHSQTPAKP